MNASLRWAGCLALLAAMLASAVGVRAAERPKRLNIWDIAIGEEATAIPDEFVNHACGTNGGPPGLPLASFADFRKCRPEPGGLREVYFEYDDELEYQARALDLKSEIRMYAGTTAFEYPIVASVLFDEAGKVRGERMVTDPRQQSTVRDRGEFWTLANFIRQRFGDSGWDCKDLPPEEGETPAGSLFVKNLCEKTDKGLRLILEQRYFRKKGQAEIDPHSGKPQPEAFESETRFEMYDATLPVRAAEAK